MHTMKPFIILTIDIYGDEIVTGRDDSLTESAVEMEDVELGRPYWKRRDLKELTNERETWRSTAN